MLTTLAVENYRSLYTIGMLLERLMLVAGANGVGKLNLYGALRLLWMRQLGAGVSAKTYGFFHNEYSVLQSTICPV